MATDEFELRTVGVNDPAHLLHPRLSRVNGIVHPQLKFHPFATRRVCPWRLWRDPLIHITVLEFHGWTEIHPVDYGSHNTVSAVSRRLFGPFLTHVSDANTMFVARKSTAS